MRYTKALLWFFACVAILFLLSHIAVLYPIPSMFILIVFSLTLLILVHTKIIAPFQRMVFTTAKIISMIIPSALILIIYYDLFGSAEFWLLLVLILLAINIFEATIVDLKNKFYFNAATGLVLIVCVPLYVRLYWISPLILIGPDAVIYWIIAYTLWNFNFVRNNFNPEKTLLHALILTASIVYIFIFSNISLWFFVRASTLMFIMNLYYTVDEKNIIPEYWYGRCWTKCNYHGNSS